MNAVSAPIIGFLSCLFAWTLVSAALGDLRAFLPWPWEVGRTLAYMALDGLIWTDIFVTISNTIAAVLISALIGTPAGIFLGLNATLYNIYRVPIDFIRSIPATALFPVAMLFLGIGDEAKLATVTLGCSLIILVNAVGAVRNLPEIYFFVGAALDFDSKSQFFKIILPAALPEMLNGLRVATAIGLILVVVLEMFTGATSGLGLRLFDYQQTFMVSEMYAVLILIGAVGYFLNIALTELQQTFIHWPSK